MTGKTITTSNDLQEAINVLYAQGCKTVIVSSSNISSNNELKCIGRNITGQCFCKLLLCIN